MVRMIHYIILQNRPICNRQIMNFWKISRVFFRNCHKTKKFFKTNEKFPFLSCNFRESMV